MSNKGFTLVELLTVIVIIALISSIATISYKYIVDNVSDKVYENYMDTMYSEASVYYLKNPDRIPSNGETVYLSLNDLNIVKINNPKGKDDYCMEESYVKVTRNDTDKMISMVYQAYLKCKNYCNCKCYNCKGNDCNNICGECMCNVES